ncbi:MAG: DUF4878 domain-containing protein [Bacteroidales bacterium]|nr:DUF4878 domain-containing protein [Bacteroidales bacterium]
MAKYIYTVLILLFFAACSQQKADEDSIEQTVYAFYKDINKNNFKEAESHCSDNMKNLIRKFKDSDINLVKYKKYTITDIEITADLAVVTVETVDIYSNNVQFKWDLIKVNDQWKINSYNSSKAMPLHDIKPQPVNQTSSQTVTEIIQDTDYADTQDTLYN